MSKKQNEWNELFWKMLIPIVLLIVFRLIIFPNTALDSWVFGGIGICFIVFILARIFPFKKYDVTISNFVCTIFIILYLLHWIFGWFA